jgi:hypothetical protein
MTFRTRNNRRTNKNRRSTRTEDTRTRTKTGDRSTDERREDIKGFEDAIDGEVETDYGAAIGDFVENAFRRGLSPSAMMFLGYLGATICLAISIYAYHRLIGPALIGALPWGFDWIAGFCLAVIIACGLNALEIFPNLETYFPQIARRLVVKLKLSPVPDPPIDRYSPSLLRPMANRAKRAQESIFKEMEQTGTVAYGIESLGALWAFQLFTSTGALNLPGAIAALFAIVGFEQCLKFASMMRELRLTAKEARIFAQHEKGLKSLSVADLNN